MANKHPSGKPVRETRQKSLSIYRVPEDGPITPGLQRRCGAYAVGFHAGFQEDDEEFEARKGGKGTKC